MSANLPDQHELIESVGRLGRELSTRTVLIHQLLAERVGLGPSDHKCLELVLRADGARTMTAGRLSELTGLTTGAITGVLDRLERHGYVRREKDPHDRRQVHIRVVPERLHDLERAFEPFRQKWREVCASFSAQELRVVARYMQRSIGAMDAFSESLRDEAGGAPAPEPALSVDEHVRSAPLGAVQEGWLHVNKRISQLQLLGGTEEQLFEARARGAAPQIEVRGGELLLSAPRGSWGSLLGKREPLQLALNTRIPWRFEFRGGLASMRADLQQLRLLELVVHGGAADLELRLPAPERPVTIQVHGGVSNVRLLRPRGAALRVAVHGGASELKIDTLELGSVGGEIRWETPDFRDQQARYDIEVHGGANRLHVSNE